MRESHIEERDGTVDSGEKLAHTHSLPARILYRYIHIFTKAHVHTCTRNFLTSQHFIDLLFVSYMPFL